MACSPISLILLPLTSLLFLLTPQIHAQTPSAPAPTPPGPINITAILVKGGQFNTLINLITTTQVANQINNQVNNSNNGMTVFAPTDNAFSNLPAGTVNNLTPQQQVQLVLYHVLPQYYSFADFMTVSNPVRTQASGQDGKVYGLYISGTNNQVNVSTGVVSTQVNNYLREQRPLAVYQLDKVLIPKEFREANAPAPSQSPPAPATPPSGSANSTESTKGPPSDSARLRKGLGLVAGLGLLCVGLLS